MATEFDETIVVEKFFAFVALDTLIAGGFACVGIGLRGLGTDEGFLFLFIAGSLLYGPFLLMYACITLTVAILPMLFVWRFVFRTCAQKGMSMRSAGIFAAPVIAVFGALAFYVGVGWIHGDWGAFKWDTLNLVGLYGAVPAVLVAPLVVDRLFEDAAFD